MNNEKIFLSNASFYFSNNINFWHCLQRTSLFAGEEMIWEGEPATGK